MPGEKLRAFAAILAGGRGTRFWPRSRTSTPKQLLNIVGDDTMLQQTAARISPLFPSAQTWAVTNTQQAPAVRRQLHRVPVWQVLAEPSGRNTTAAIGFAAIHIRHAIRHILRQTTDDGVMAVLPADHYIADAAKYRSIVRAAIEVAEAPGKLVVLGIPPTRPDTGFGYIELAGAPKKIGGAKVFGVRQFTEKPPLPTARRYVASRKYLWNAGMFFWRISTFMDALHRFQPKIHAQLEDLAATIGTSRYDRAVESIYPRIENISVDYAILEPSTRGKKGPTVSVIPAKVGWSDIGSWEAVYELLAKKAGANVTEGLHLFLDATGNLVWSPRKFVAAIGIRDLVVVETSDALLICPRDRAQDVGKIVKWLEEKKRQELL
ncbi:MAG TPA: sugar phosphate nucleotidyltransferase [Candidatus Acidoferrales bacterium]|jgi:mannose-1-phosphate guanylyltransferase|nr:sugar phosphate nucleotidyltransferase [Candidatus Acidoferrales bacterium]